MRWARLLIPWTKVFGFDAFPNNSQEQTTTTSRSFPFHSSSKNSQMTSYRRVPQRDTGTPDYGSNLEASVTRSRAERLTDKLTALAWIILAIVVARWTNFYHAVFQSEEANRIMMRLAACGLGIITSLFLYLAVYLPRVKGITDSSAWPIYCPKVIPTMTAVSIVTYLFALRGMWPVFGFLSPLIFGTQLMGAFMALHFIPAGSIF